MMKILVAASFLTFFPISTNASECTIPMYPSSQVYTTTAGASKTTGSSTTAFQPYSWLSTAGSCNVEVKLENGSLPDLKFDYQWHTETSRDSIVATLDMGKLTTNSSPNGMTVAACLLELTRSETQRITVSGSPDTGEITASVLTFNLGGGFTQPFKEEINEVTNTNYIRARTLKNGAYVWGFPNSNAVAKLESLSYKGLCDCTKDYFTDGANKVTCYEPPLPVKGVIFENAITGNKQAVKVSLNGASQTIPAACADDGCKTGYTWSQLQTGNQIMVSIMPSPSEPNFSFEIDTTSSPYLTVHYPGSRNVSITTSPSNCFTPGATRPETCTVRFSSE